VVLWREGGGGSTQPTPLRDHPSAPNHLRLRSFVAEPAEAQRTANSYTRPPLTVSDVLGALKRDGLVEAAAALRA
jgi:hypothetical protein